MEMMPHKPRKAWASMGGKPHGTPEHALPGARLGITQAHRVETRPTPRPMSTGVLGMNKGHELPLGTPQCPSLMGHDDGKCHAAMPPEFGSECIEEKTKHITLGHVQQLDQ